jgi:hypothetical protein
MTLSMKAFQAYSSNGVTSTKVLGTAIALPAGNYQALNVGDWLVGWVATDNLASTGPTVASITGPGGAHGPITQESVSWNATAGAVATFILFRTQVTTAYSAGTTTSWTINLSSSVTAKIGAMTAIVSTGSGLQWSTVDTSGTGQLNTTRSYTVDSSWSGALLLGGASTENAAVPLMSAPTATSSFAPTDNTTGGGGATNIGGRGYAMISPNAGTLALTAAPTDGGMLVWRADELVSVGSTRSTTWNVGAPAVVAPQLVNTLSQAHFRNNTNISFTVQNVQVGDLLVCKYMADDSDHAMTIATTGQTWTQRAIVNVLGRCEGIVWTCVATTSGTLTVNLTLVSPNLWSHSAVVEHWRGAQLAATPATNTLSTGTAAAPSSSLTTVQDNSVVSWVVGDWTAQNVSTAAYRSSAVEEFKTGTAGQDYGAYYARQAALTAGAQTYGLTAPGGQTPTMIAIEIQGTPSGAGTTTVGSSRATSWNTAATIVETQPTTWHVRSTTVETQATTWTALAAAVASRSTSWNVIGVVSSSRSSSWHVRLVVSGSRSSTWHVLASTAATRGTTWTVAATLVVSRSTTWNVAGTLAAVVVTRSTTWTVRQAVAVTRSTSWLVLAAVVETQPTSWRVLSSTSITRSTTWNALAALLSARATSWGVLTPASATRASTWHVRAVVTPTRSTTWNVAGTLTTITVSRSTTWTIRALLVETQPTTWHTRALLVETQATSWNALAALSAARSTSWGVRALLVVTRSSTWHAASLVASSRATSWNVAGSLVAVVVTRSTTWHARQALSASRMTLWHALARSNASTRATTWQTLQSVSAARTTSWGSRGLVSVPRAASWRVLEPVVSSRWTSWAVSVLNAGQPVDGPLLLLDPAAGGLALDGSPGALTLDADTARLEIS